MAIVTIIILLHIDIVLSIIGRVVLVIEIIEHIFQRFESIAFLSQDLYELIMLHMIFVLEIING
jgi:hypothetical protein